MRVLNPDGTLANPYSQYIALSRYARYLDTEHRRETWAETVDRYMGFMVEHLAIKHCYRPDPALVEEIRAAIKNLDVVPSMRAIMTAGPALERSHIAAYNCSYLPITDLYSFVEAFYILLNGTGVGYSVERLYVDQLPTVHPDIADDPHTVLYVGDSKEGWAHAFHRFLESVWLNGKVPSVDVSAVRPRGARLKTFGGRASGPGPILELFSFAADLLRGAAGRKLRPIEVHDLMCKIASVVVVGGVRRSAMIALSDLDDKEMAEAKKGRFWETHPHRSLANISAVFKEDLEVTREEFDAFFDDLIASGSGERGIFNRTAAQIQAFRNGRKSGTFVEYGTNPCGEIILRPYSFCNLTEAIVRPDDTLQTLKRKVELATILGTWQATLTDFPLLRPEWKRNAEEERLLGVSLTGIFGNRLTYDLEQVPTTLTALQLAAREANKEEAYRIGITPAHAICTVKPSGTVSQLAGVSSGIHPWHSRYYIRTVRADKKDPLAQLMADAGVPHEDDVTAPETTWVFSFPIAAPPDAVTRDDLSAVDHLKLWMAYHSFWCHHNASVTVNVRADEWDKVRQWAWDHLDSLVGVTFLPYDEHVYAQAPYQEIDEVTYQRMVANFPKVRWADLVFYETSDQTAGTQVLACTAGGCEDVDLVGEAA